MDIMLLKELINEMEMKLAFDNIEAESDCSLCCANGNGGTTSSGC